MAWTLLIRPNTLKKEKELMKHTFKSGIGFLLMFAGVSHAGPELSMSVTTLPDRPGSDRVFGHDIVVIAPDDIWAVGEWRETSPSSDLDLGTQTFHFDGSSWARIDLPHHVNNCGRIWSVAKSIDARGPGEVYAVGDYKRDSCQSTDTLMYEYNSGSWSQVITPGQTQFGTQGYLFAGVHISDDGTIWMGGQFTVQQGPPRATVIRDSGGGGYDRWDGDWISNSAHRIRAIDSISPDDVWAVGSAGGSAVAVGRSYAMHYDGTGFEERSPPNLSFGEIIRAVEAIATDDVWLSGVYEEIGKNGSVHMIPLMWHWNGSGWTQFSSPAFAVDLVHYASDNIYGINGRTLVHWDGSSWSIAAVVPDELALDPNLRSLGVVNGNELIAIGDQGPSTSRSTVVIRFTMQGSSCVADFNNDGTLDFFDLQVFLQVFSDGDSAADLNDDGTLDFFDIQEFLQLFANGCP
jgi:hypothetical protein